MGEHAVCALAWWEGGVSVGLFEVGGRRTAVGVEEADVAIFVAAEYHALHATARACGSMYHALVFRNPSCAVEAERAFESNGCSCDCVDAGGWGAVVGF